MKRIKIILVVFSMLAVFACNNQQSKKGEKHFADTANLLSEKPVIKKSHPEQKDFKPCDNIVKEILITSPRFKRLTKGLYNAVVKNGGKSFGINMEGSPNPQNNKGCSYSKTYDFTLYEMYTDRQLNTARFSFNPKDKKLYEYDAVLDQLDQIAFDRTLLLKYEALCK
jgi:hypothetical protein